MLTWRLAIPFDTALETPLFLQIAQGIRTAIEGGRLRAGDALPGIRALAEELGVSRNTVQSAYQELTAEGLLVGRSGGGTFVTDSQPKATPTPTSGARGLGFALPEAPGAHAARTLPGAVMACLTGHSDPRMLPMVALARAYRRAMESKDASFLLRETPQGHPRLRAALAAMLSVSKGLQVTDRTLLITRGVKDAMDLLARALLRPGDRVAVEDPGLSDHWEVLRRAGADLVPVPVDDKGIHTASLEAALADGPFRMVLVTPQCQYPTTVVMAQERRQVLLDLARRHAFAVVEVDQDADFPYSGAPVLPLAASDAHGVVIHLSAFSKVLFPNLPLAFLHAPEALITHLVAWRQAVEHGGDPILERAISELLENGEIQRHLNRLRKTCHERRDVLIEALTACMPDLGHLVPPRSGMALWLEAPPGLDVETWARRALQQGIAFRAGREFTFGARSIPFLRMGFGALDAPELREAARRLAAARP